MKLIKLTKGQFAQVDDHWFDYLMQWNWYAGESHSGYYAMRKQHNPNGKHKAIFMHRVILGLTDSELICDHIDHNTLNNLERNLRSATRRQNQQNMKSFVNSSSQYVGVSLIKGRNKWAAQICINGKQTNLGRFNVEEDAARARNAAAIKYFGDRANLNVLPEDISVLKNNSEKEHLDLRNLANASQRLNINNTSGYVGVKRQKNSWIARLGSGNNRQYLGCFATPEDAAIAYNEAALIKYGDRANLNIL